MGSTIRLVLGLIIMDDLLLRWLYVNRRRLAWEKVKRKQEAKQEQYEKEHTADSGAKIERVPIDEPELKFHFRSVRCIWIRLDRWKCVS